MLARLYVGVALGLLMCAGCGEAPWQPSPLAALDSEVPEMWTEPDFVPFEPGPDDPSAIPAGVERAPGEPIVHFLNFCDGTTTLKQGSDNAPKSTSQICGHTSAGCVKYPGSEADKKSFADALHAMFLPYNLVVVTKRPGSGLYSMEMIAPRGNGCDMGASVGGVAPGDCGNRSNVNVSFTFSPKGFPGVPGYVITAQETGHAWGLSHVDTACDVMGAAYSSKGCPGGKWGYPDASNRVIGGAVCPGQSTQNSHQMLIKNLGPWMGGPKPPVDGPACEDKTPPVVDITEPAAGGKVPGAMFMVKATVTDDCMPVKKAKITLPAFAKSAESTMAPFEWKLEAIAPTKSLEITVEAWDSKDQVSKKSIMVEVTGSGGAGGGSGSGGAGGAGGTGGSGGGTGGGGNGGSRADPKVTGGCSIAAGASPGVLSILPLALAAIAGLRGRRQSVSRNRRTEPGRARRPGREARGARIARAM